MTPGLTTSLGLMATALSTKVLGTVVDATPMVDVVKDATVSGLLALAVVVLYRELARERKQNDEAKLILREFIKSQSGLMLDSAKKQVEALEEVVRTLGHLQDVSAQQIKTYDKHIDALVTAATQKKA